MCPFSLCPRMPHSGWLKKRRDCRHWKCENKHLSSERTQLTSLPVDPWESNSEVVFMKHSWSERGEKNHCLWSIWHASSHQILPITSWSGCCVPLFTAGEDLPLTAWALLWTLPGSRLVSSLNLVQYPAKWAWPAASFGQIAKVSSSRMLPDPKIAGHHQA